MNRLIRWLRSAIFLARIAAPFIWMICINALRLELLAVIALWSGVSTSLNRMANEWLDRAIRHGWPTLYSAQLYYTLYGLAFVMVLAGWILCSYTTMIILHLIF
jgi:hypothetical protein